MKKEDLARAIGEAEDKYVEEASGEIPKVTFLSRIRRADKSRLLGGLAVAAAVCIVAGFGLGGAGINLSLTGKSASESFVTEDMSSDGIYYESDGFADESSKYEYAESLNSVTSSSSSSETYNAAQNVKLIYTADLTLQTTDFETAEAAIRALAEKYGAYFESSNVNNGSYFADSYRKNGYYVVRIPSDQYEAFLNETGNIGHVSSMTQSVEDVGEEYFDLESRIETLKNKEARLEELLKQAGDLSDIITIEDELSDTQYQLDKYTSNLNHYDSLINYSTINITLNSVTQVDPTPEDSFLTRLGQSLKYGFEDSLDGIEDFIIGIGYNLVDIVIWLAVLFIIWRFRLISRLWKLITRKK